MSGGFPDSTSFLVFSFASHSFFYVSYWRKGDIMKFQLDKLLRIGFPLRRSGPFGLLLILFFGVFAKGPAWAQGTGTGGSPTPTGSCLTEDQKKMVIDKLQAEEDE